MTIEADQELCYEIYFPHRDLHSFPTRRSSDLNRPTNPIRICAFSFTRAIMEQAQLWHEDRKSTRLNSSHANISYAVFCLKKKTGGNPVAVTPLGEIFLAIAAADSARERKRLDK